MGSLGEGEEAGVEQRLISITIRDARDDSEVSLQFRPTETIRRIQQRLHLGKVFPMVLPSASTLELLYGGLTLPEEDTLAEHDIEDGASFNLRLAHVRLPVKIRYW